MSRQVICREHKRCHRQETCHHARWHRDTGPDCWPDTDSCPGCSDGTEAPPEWRQKPARKLGMREIKDYAVMREYDNADKIAIH